MSRLAHRVLEAITDGPLWHDEDRVAVAISGGADSVALVRILGGIVPHVAWTLAGLMHVHHGLRGAEADADAAFCRDLADRQHLPIEIVHVDVPAAMAAGGRSIEVTARALRYAAFERAARALGATIVATGHTADDQAETVLLRLLRGASVRGASGIRARRGPYARPLLGVRRADLRAHLEAIGQPWREDASNADVSIPRNRLRQHLMPVIERDWPGAVPALARFAALTAEDERLLTAQAASAAADVIRPGSDGVELIRQPLDALPAPVARRVIRRAVELAGGTPIRREIADVYRTVRRGRPGGGLDLHGLRVECTPEGVVLRGHRPAGRGATYACRLDPGATVQVTETGAEVRASFLTAVARPGVSPGWDATAALQASSVTWPLTVRCRQPGDRMRPIGAPGRRRLQDLFVDRKVPRVWRARWPVVVDATGQIVWVPGVAVAESCRVRVPEGGMVILEFKKGIP